MTYVDSNASHEVKVQELPATLTLRGRKLVLKSPTPQDDDRICKIFSYPPNVEFLPHFHRTNGWMIEEIVLRRQNQLNCQQQGKALVLFMHLLVDDEFGQTSSAHQDKTTLVGTTGFTNVDLENGIAEIGIILHKPYWKQGLCTESMFICLQYAFDILGLQRVDWLTLKENIGMRGFCEGLLGLKPSVKKLEMEGWMEYSLMKSQWYSGLNKSLEQRVFMIVS